MRFLWECFWQVVSFHGLKVTIYHKLMQRPFKNFYVLLLVHDHYKVGMFISMEIPHCHQHGYVPLEFNRLVLVYFISGLFGVE